MIIGAADCDWLCAQLFTSCGQRTMHSSLNFPNQQRQAIPRSPGNMYKNCHSRLMHHPNTTSTIGNNAGVAPVRADPVLAAPWRVVRRPGGVEVAARLEQADHQGE
jgi:hypothetical protein